MPRPGSLPLVIGNWKMHLTATHAAAYLRELLPLLPRRSDREIALAPPFTALAAAASLLAAHPGVRLAAQDVAWEDEGPFTGEVSAPMLKDLGVAYVLVGHSERRANLGESDLLVSRKLRAALRGGLAAVVCVGEGEEAHRKGRAADIVRAQLAGSLAGAPPNRAGSIVLAYEPVWAIGTGLAASPEDASEMHALIRLELGRILGPAGAAVRILYGGSVTPRNVDALMAGPGVDGVLVGGASLEAAAFARIAGFLPVV